MNTVLYTVANGRVIAEKRNGVRKKYLPDPLGSTVALLDNTQTQTDTFSYWPYGEVNIRTGSTPTPFQFVGTLGYYQDSSSKTYVRARHLDTQKGRWLTQDPIGFDGGDLNLYRYANNRPVVLTDWSGMFGRPPFNCPKPPNNCQKQRNQEDCVACCNNNRTAEDNQNQQNTRQCVIAHPDKINECVKQGQHCGKQIGTEFRKCIDMCKKKPPKPITGPST